MKSILLLLVGVLAILSPARADFIDEEFISGQGFITRLAFSPDGKLLFIEKETGLVKIVIGPNYVRPEPFYEFTVDSQGERGGLGITFHPQYPDSPYVYCYVTIPEPNLANVVIRLVDRDGFGADPDTIFRAPIEYPTTNHNGGNIKFGPDGKLYISIGDNGQSSLAQDLCQKQGKILRINYDGTIPPDNPFECAPVFAYGFRNTYGFCFHPLTGALYSTDNGPEGNDEINRVRIGLNYGWPEVQCASSDPDYEDAIMCWSPSIAPTGIIAVQNSSIPEFDGKLLMGDFVTGNLHILTLSADGNSITYDQRVFSAGSGIIDIAEGLDGHIYIATSSNSIIRLRPETNAPSAFPLRSPVPNAKVVGTITHFVWESSTDMEGGISYQLQVSGDPDFRWPYHISNVSGTSDSIMTDSLYALGNVVYWRILAIDSDNNITFGGTPMAESRLLNVLFPGDADADGMLDGIDIVFLLSYLRSMGTPPDPYQVGDANGDCIVDGQDIVLLISYFKGGALPVRGECISNGRPRGR